MFSSNAQMSSSNAPQMLLKYSNAHGHLHICPTELSLTKVLLSSQMSAAINLIFRELKNILKIVLATRHSVSSGCSAVEKMHFGLP